MLRGSLRELLVSRGLVHSRTQHSRLFDQAAATILITSLDDPGPSIVLRKFLAQEDGGSDVQLTFPIVGFTIEVLTYGRVTFQAHEMQEQKSTTISELEHGLFLASDAVIFVVGCDEQEKMGGVGEQIRHLFKHRDSRITGEQAGIGKRKPLLVLTNTNTTDLGAGGSGGEKGRESRPWDADRVGRELRLEDLGGDAYPYHVEMVCISTGEGVYEGLKWVSDVVKDISLERIRGIAEMTRKT
ncbi:uncharacterized protein DNG_06711 [Cephalotrichum gorgonifer]|uniref:Uncharacterized protein n=1 Tax=Cephalotrichum gorgonifer TaxID=2041049 RepID=A0AAE8N2Z4_9PEZI|nr:uncharacterized protein DNG_06711 [Cephalotrichum gorgonifer]